MTANILVRVHCRYSNTKYKQYSNEHHHGGGGVWCGYAVVIVPLVGGGDVRRCHEECCATHAPADILGNAALTHDIFNILHLNHEHNNTTF